MHNSIERIALTWWDLNTYLRLEDSTLVANEIESLFHKKILDGDDDGCLAISTMRQCEMMTTTPPSFSKIPKNK